MWERGVTFQLLLGSLKKNGRGMQLFCNILYFSTCIRNVNSVPTERDSHGGSAYGQSSKKMSYPVLY